MTSSGVVNPPFLTPRSHSRQSWGSTIQPVDDFRKESIVKGLVGPYDSYCDGYGNPGTSGNSYVSVVNIAFGVFEHKENLDFGMQSIIAYDMAEAGFQSDSAYVGQINMLQASSFCGLNGLVWGYDVARNPLLDVQEPLFHVGERNTPVYSMDPLFDGGKALLGVKDKRVYPILPGAHVICAFKEYTSTPEDLNHDHYMWCALALGIAADRTTMADCFMEGKGKVLVSEVDDIPAWENKTLRDVVCSYDYIGKAQNVIYKEIYVGLKWCKVPKGHHGCALVSSPYLVLPKNAIPESGPESLITMDLPTWIGTCGGDTDNPLSGKYKR
jgi:histidine decarboxylase